MSRLFALVGLCIALAAARNAYICEVMLENFCPLADQSQCPADPTMTFGNTEVSFAYYNLISFGNMYGPSGDVEGRAAVKGNVDLRQYSIGYQLATGGVAANSPSLPYTMVVGGNAVWYGGSVHPDGTGFPYQGPKEYIFVGSDFSQASADLQLDRTGSCNGNANCLDPFFNNAQAYYNMVSAGFAALPTNANFNLQPWGTMELTCNSYSDSRYVISITPTQFSTINFWAPAPTCNPNSQFVVNIQGAGSVVKFFGQTQSLFKNAKTLYNVVPSANTPSVRVEVGVNGNLLAPSSNYNQPNMGVFIGQVIVANVQEVLQINFVKCDEPIVQNPPNSSNLCPGWETNCVGLDVVLAQGTYSFRDFNVISFGDFNADTGDVEGRLIAAKNVNLGAGYSIGYELQTATNQPDRSLPYSLVVGGNLNWVSGALYPQGNGIPFPGNKEDMYVGGTATTSSDLQERVHTGAGDLAQEFTDAKTCYTGYSNTMAARPDNVAHSIQWSALNIVCNNPTGTDYTISLTPEEMSQFTYTTTSGCNFQARWYINIRGTGDVLITGDSFPGVPGGIVYNIIGSRTVTVTGTKVNGAILAPNANLKQTGGVIVGKVVAGNVEFSLQINMQNTCPNPQTIQIPSIVTVPSADSIVVTVVADNLRPGDYVFARNSPAQITGYNCLYVLTGHSVVYASQLLCSQSRELRSLPHPHVSRLPLVERHQELGLDLYPEEVSLYPVQLQGGL